MIEGAWMVALIIVLGIITTFFLYKQNKNMNDIEILPGEGKEEALSALSDKEVRVRRCITDITGCIRDGAKAFVYKEMGILLGYVVTFCVIIFMLTGSRGRKDYLVTDKGVIVEFAQDWVFGTFSAIAFVCGAMTSGLAGYVGVLAAVQANGRVAHKISDRRDPDRRPPVQKGFETCLRGGAVMAFGMFAVGIINLLVLMSLYVLHYDTCDGPTNCRQKAVCNTILAYGLGGSSIAILHRMGGSIFMKAIDYSRLMLINGGGLVHTEYAKHGDGTRNRIDLPRFDARQPATIADQVGDIIGDVAGTGADFFGSFSQAICATLAILASSVNSLEDDRSTPVVSHWAFICLPLMIFQSGLVVSMILYLLTVSKTSPFNPVINQKPSEAEDQQSQEAATPSQTIPDGHNDNKHITKNLVKALWNQVLAATLFMVVIVFLICVLMLPDQIYVDYWLHEGTKDRENLLVTDWQLGLCGSIGCLIGLMGAFIGMRYTAEDGTPVQEVVDACTRDADFLREKKEELDSGPTGRLFLLDSMNAGDATLLGLYFARKSTIASVLNLAIGIYTCHAIGRGLGIAFAALGCMSCVCSMLITTTFGPIAKNAYAIAEMSGMDQTSKDAAERLATAGGNVLAMSKNFSITAAALCSMALVSAFVLRANVQRANVSIFEPVALAGLLIGAMLPYRLSAMIQEATLKTATLVQENIKNEFIRRGEEIMGGARPEYQWHVENATAEALRNLVPSGLLIIFTPVLVGLLFGRAAVATVVVGALISGVPLACYMGISGGIWSMVRQHLKDEYFGPQEGYKTEKAKLALLEIDRQDGHFDDDFDSEAYEQIKEDVRKMKPDQPFINAELNEDVGELLKDAIAPAITIMIKEMAMITLVLGPYFAVVRGGYGIIGCTISHNCDESRYPLEGFDYVILSLLGTVVGFLVLYRCFFRQVRPNEDRGKHASLETDQLLNKASAMH